MNNISINNMTLNDIIQTVIQFQEKKKKITEGNTRRQKKYIENNREKYNAYAREYQREYQRERRRKLKILKNEENNNIK